MTVGITVDAVVDEVQYIFAASDLCKRVRFRKSTCHNCVDVCPENAITLSPGPSINDNCSHCGLCQNACPTEVFQHDVNMDELLLKQVEPLPSKDLGKGQASVDKKKLFIHCSQANKQDENSLATLCLGVMSENFLLRAALSGVGEVNLSKGYCTQCHLKNAEALLTNSMTTSQELVKNMGIDEFVLSLHEAQKDNSDETLSRREFFLKIADRVSRSVTPTLRAQAEDKIVNQQLDIKDGKRPSPKREILRQLIKQSEQSNTNANLNQQVFPWKKMQVDEAKCVACAICVNVCPTGALTKVFENYQVVRHLTNSLCTNCNLCQEACPESAIRFADHYSVRDLTEDKSHVVARIDMTACVICGEINPAGSGEICTTCAKRQISPMFMNL